MLKHNNFLLYFFFLFSSKQEVLMKTCTRPYVMKVSFQKLWKYIRDFSGCLTREIFEKHETFFLL